MNNLLNSFIFKQINKSILIKKSIAMINITIYDDKKIFYKIYNKRNILYDFS
jgi:hypothetical protein